MATEPFDNALELPVAGVIDDSRPSRVEAEVMELFDELRAPLLRYQLSLGLPVQDAEEVVQEVFLALHRHLREGKSRSNLRAWTFTVAHNLALRSRMRSQREDAAMPEDAADPSPGPEERLAASQRQATLQAVVRALPEQDRLCLSLRAEGLRYREIARILGISLGSVANSLERSLARLIRADEYGSKYATRD